MSVVREVEVPVDPATAFAIFTDEIDAWYERGPYSWNVPERAVGIRFEGGRLLELHDDGGSFEMGRVVAWEPGERLVLAYRNVHLELEDTELEVRFEPVGEGTRVTLEHRGLERLPARDYELWRKRAWKRLVEVFAAYARTRSTS